MAGETGAIFANQLLGLIFNGTAIPGIATNATSNPLTVLYASLHTADPTATGNQTSYEVTYTPYARLPVARTTGGWTLNGNSVSPVASLIWPVPSGSAGQTVLYWAIGTVSSGAGLLMYAGPIAPAQVVTLGLPPTITPASTVTQI